MSSLIYAIQPGDSRALYRQIVEQVKAAIAAGRLRPGEQLPTHRELARELVVAPLTVKKAYDCLQAEGLITMSQGRGTFVSERPPARRVEARRELAARAAALVRQARILGLSEEELRALVERQWRRGGLVGQRRR